MHPRAIPDSDSSAGKEYVPSSNHSVVHLLIPLRVQGTLDGIVVAKPRPPVFTREGLRDFLIEMIVTQDEV
jgi:hypothetical protein